MTLKSFLFVSIQIVDNLNSQAGSEISIVLHRFLETQVALPEHALQQLLDYT